VSRGALNPASHGRVKTSQCSRSFLQVLISLVK
jgi:hypothetical protein